VSCSTFITLLPVPAGMSILEDPGSLPARPVGGGRGARSGTECAAGVE